MSILSKIIGSESGRLIKRWNPEVEKTNAFEKEIGVLSDEDFKARTEDLKEKVKNGTSLDELLPEAFAMVRETSLRIRNERHYCRNSSSLFEFTHWSWSTYCYSERLSFSP